VAELHDCEAEAERQFDVLEGVTRRTVVVTGELASCVAELTELADECVVDSAILRTCGAAFAGTVAPAGDCANALDCEHGGDAVACIRVDAAAATSGTCRRLEPAAFGEPCLMTLSERPHGITHISSEANPPLAYCDIASELYCSTVSGTCQSLAASGEPCATAQACQAGLACVETCREAKPLGASCSISSECLSPLRCIEGECRHVRFASPQLCGGDLN
jgi:hypothetical protein